MNKVVFGCQMIGVRLELFDEAADFVPEPSVSGTQNVDNVSNT